MHMKSVIKCRKGFAPSVKLFWCFFFVATTLQSIQSAATLRGTIRGRCLTKKSMC